MPPLRETFQDSGCGSRNATLRVQVERWLGDTKQMCDDSHSITEE
ncbi:hypothetical protein [Kutzneria sp. 744]|nr:hypothetical protein [Kutzneria sp. 744]